MSGAADNAKHQPSLSKRWTFRVAAVLLGLSPFLIAEATLRLTDWKPTIPPGDPFVDFHSVRPLFVADIDNRMMVTAENRLKYFQPESFATKKDANEYRIFCIGGSTVQGRPYAIETSFTTWLELSLKAADPSRQWNAVNCGGVSYASYRLVPIVEEVLGYDPDLIVLYTGHNEFLEDRSYALAKKTPAFVSAFYARLSHLKGLQFLHQSLANNESENSSVNDKQKLSTEVDALLDYQGGLEHYHRDVDWRQSVIEHFEFNLRRMIRLSSLAEVPMVVVDPAANMRGCPPFKSEHSALLAANSLAKVQQLIAQSVKADTGQSILMLERANTIDPNHAGIHFRLASHYADGKHYQKAKQHFRLALEEDVCPLRIIHPLNQVVQKVANETGIPCVKARRTFEKLSNGAIPGDDLFFDHVHPTFHGHQVIASEIAKTLISMGIVKPTTSWESKRDELFDQHWKSLDTVYFERGKQRLNALELWTKGRAKKLH